jgi:hypothetical protein
MNPQCKILRLRLWLLSNIVPVSRGTTGPSAMGYSDDKVGFKVVHGGGPSPCERGQPARAGDEPKLRGHGDTMRSLPITKSQLGPCHHFFIVGTLIKRGHTPSVFSVSSVDKQNGTRSPTPDP